MVAKTRAEAGEGDTEWEITNLPVGRSIRFQRPCWYLILIAIEIYNMMEGWRIKEQVIGMYLRKLERYCELRGCGGCRDRGTLQSSAARIEAEHTGNSEERKMWSANLKGFRLRLGAPLRSHCQSSIQPCQSQSGLNDCWARFAPQHRMYYVHK
jgi:hypothetical protein